MNNNYGLTQVEPYFFHFLPLFLLGYENNLLLKETSEIKGHGNIAIIKSGQKKKRSSDSGSGSSTAQQLNPHLHQSTY